MWSIIVIPTLAMVTAVAVVQVPTYVTAKKDLLDLPVKWMLTNVTITPVKMELRVTAIQKVSSTLVTVHEDTPEFYVNKP